MPWRFNPFTGNLDETDIPAFNGEVTLGSAASPSIFFTGDTNTGIYSPGADQLALSTNATERLRITSAGLVGIGASAHSNRLHVQDTSGSAQFRITGTGGYTELYSDGNFYIQPNGSTKMVVQSGGNAGIGTTSPTQRLQVTDGSLSNFYIAPGYNGGTGTTIGVGGGEYLAFSAAPFSTERARIDSSGRLLVGTSSDSGGALLQVNGDRVRIATAKTPASATDTGTTGEVCWDANYVYVCTATNTWKRSALSTW